MARHAVRSLAVGLLLAGVALCLRPSLWAAPANAGAGKTKPAAKADTVTDTDEATDAEEAATGDEEMKTDPPTKTGKPAKAKPNLKPAKPAKPAAAKKPPKAEETEKDKEAAKEFRTAKREIQQQLRSKQTSDRVAAVKRLREFSNTDSLKLITQNGLKDAEPAVRQAAFEALLSVKDDAEMCELFRTSVMKDLKRKDADETVAPLLAVLLSSELPDVEKSAIELVDGSPDDRLRMPFARRLPIERGVGLEEAQRAIGARIAAYL